MAEELKRMPLGALWYSMFIVIGAESRMLIRKADFVVTRLNFSLMEFGWTKLPLDYKTPTSMSGHIKEGHI